MIITTQFFIIETTKKIKNNYYIRNKGLFYNPIWLFLYFILIKYDFMNINLKTAQLIRACFKSNGA